MALLFDEKTFNGTRHAEAENGYCALNYIETPMLQSDTWIEFLLSSLSIKSFAVTHALMTRIFNMVGYPSLIIDAEITIDDIMYEMTMEGDGSLRRIAPLMKTKIQWHKKWANLALREIRCVLLHINHDHIVMVYPNGYYVCYEITDQILCSMCVTLQHHLFML